MARIERHSSRARIVLYVVLLLGVRFALGQAAVTDANAAGSDTALPFSYDSLSPVEKQAATQSPRPEPVQTDAAAPHYSDTDFLRDQLLLQAGVVILLCIVTMTALSLLLIYLYRTKAAPAQMVNGAGLTLIIFGTVFLAYTVNDKDQLIASVGILGAIAGYLFGTASGRSGAPTREPD
jgi:hypothetical protein